MLVNVSPHRHVRRACRYRYALVGAASTLVVLRLVVRPVIIVGNSMRPALRHHQVVLMECGARAVRVGDVVVFRAEGASYVKRVVAIGGGMAEIARFPNGGTMVLNTPRALQIARCFRRHNPGVLRIQRIRIRPGMLFVVGDNETNSLDSRHFGPIRTDQVTGRLVSLSSIGPLWRRQVAFTVRGALGRRLIGLGRLPGIERRLTRRIPAPSGPSRRSWASRQANGRASGEFRTAALKHATCRAERLQ